MPRYIKPETKTEYQKATEENASRHFYEFHQDNPFPGSLDWQVWSAEQTHLKKRSVGAIRRLGRAAVDLMANNIIAKDQADELRYAKNRQRTERRIANFEQYKQEAESGSRRSAIAKRAGRAAVSHLTKNGRAERKAAKQSALAAAQQEAAENSVNKAQWSTNRLWAERHQQKIARKQYEKGIERAQYFRYLQNNAKQDYLQNHPEAAPYRYEQQREDYLTDARSRYSARAQTIGEAFNSQQADSIAMQMPKAQANMGSKAYNLKANSISKRAIKTMQEYRAEDGSLPVLPVEAMHAEIIKTMPREMNPDHANLQDAGFNARRNVFDEKFDKGDVFTSEAATALWKTGFVDFATHKDSQSHWSVGSFSKDIEWGAQYDESKEAMITHANIPFDANNELHVMIAGSNAGVEQGGYIRLSTPNEDVPEDMIYQNAVPDMRLSFVPQSTYVQYDMQPSLASA